MWKSHPKYPRKYLVENESGNVLDLDTEETITSGKIDDVPIERFVWECYHGKLPSRYVVQFVDGNSSNLALKNLRAVLKRDLLAQVRKLQEELE